MNTNRIIIALFLVLFCIGIKAQTAPKTISMQVEDFEYKRPTAGKIALNVLVAVTDPKTIYMPDKSMVAQICEAIASGASNLPWVNRPSDQNATADYRLKGVITTAETNTGNPAGCMIRVVASIVDESTGKEVASKAYRGWSDTFYDIDNMATLKTQACRRLAHETEVFIFEALPVTGSILEKGVEQINGKVKENQCYVDLGSLHGIYPDMRLYITQNGKYKGELKVIEVMGDDLCSCKIIKGASFITKSIEKDAQMVVTSKPKKIKDQDVF